MSIQLHQTLNSTKAKVLLDEIHEHVSRYHGRVVITREGADARCVLISEAELLGMEKALEILSGTKDAAAMRAEVLRIASELAQQARLPAGSLS